MKKKLKRTGQWNAHGLTHSKCPHCKKWGTSLRMSLGGETLQCGQCGEQFILSKRQ